MLDLNEISEFLCKARASSIRLDMRLLALCPRLVEKDGHDNKRKS